MLTIATYATWAAALFFAGAWTFGLVAAPQQRLASTILTVMLWWVGIAVSAAGALSVFHLLWMFPAALVLPVLLLGGRRL